MIHVVGRLLPFRMRTKKDKAEKKSAKAAVVDMHLNDTVVRKGSGDKRVKSKPWPLGPNDLRHFEEVMREALATQSTDFVSVMNMYNKAAMVAAYLPDYPDAPAVQAIACLYAGERDKAIYFNNIALTLDPENKIGKRVAESLNKYRDDAGTPADVPSASLDEQSHESKN